MMSLNNCTLHCGKTCTGESYWASFEVKSFSRGRDFKVYSGLMNGKGPRSGNRCVVKVFRRCVGTESLCRYEEKKRQKAQELAKVFNKIVHTKDTRVKIAELYWAEMDEVSTIKRIFFSGRRKLCQKDYVLIEEDLRFDDETTHKSRELTMFMDRHGKNRSCVAKDLEAFSHFTYHRSNGELVICNLNGVQDEEGFYLKTPIIHSRNQEYGDSDRGKKGILEVFSNHVCNDICKDMNNPLNALDNFSANNRNYIPIGKCSSVLSSATITMCPEGQNMIPQDISNNNSTPLENPDDVDFLRSRTDDHVMPRKQSSSSSRCISNMSGYLEPSAPIAEDCDENMFNHTPPLYNETFVANWLLQEQDRNCFTTCRHVEPLSHQTGVGSLVSQSSVDSGICRSRSSSNGSSTAVINDNTDPSRQRKDKCGGCNRNIIANCEMKQQISCTFDGPVSPVASSFPHLRNNFTNNSAMTCQNSNTSFQVNSPFSQYPIPFCTPHNPKTISYNAFPPINSRFGSLDAGGMHDNAGCFFNGNQFLQESPPSYMDSVMQEFW